MKCARVALDLYIYHITHSFAVQSDKKGAEADRMKHLT